MRNRLRASELLAKANGDFIEKRIVQYHQRENDDAKKIDYERKFLQELVKHPDLMDALDAVLEKVAEDEGPKTIPPPRP